MSREIRRVPPGWEHPRKPSGGHKPLIEGYLEAAASFRDDPQDWDNQAPDPDDYMPEFGEAATAFQVYESVSEGTPISPVLATEDDLIGWLTTDGSGLGIGGRKMPLTGEQAKAFVRSRFAPSMVYSNATGLVSGLEAQHDPE